MSDFYGCRVRDDYSHEVYVTTDGRDRIPLPRAAFGNPREAIRYAEMRQANVSPLRVEPDGSSHQESRLPDPALRPAAGHAAGRAVLGDPSR